MQYVGELFAACKYDPAANTVEPVTDSSRYFVIKVENDKGQHSFIGLGFQERTTAFDFNVCLQDHIKHVETERDAEKRRREYESQPKKDYSLGGQNIQINLPASSKPRHPPSTTHSSSSSGGFSLPPPPGKEVPAPQPLKAPQQAQQQQSTDWGDFQDFTSSTQGETSSDWATFE